MKVNRLREGVRGIALLGTLVLAVPVYLAALQDSGTAVVAFLFLVFLATWTVLQIKRHAVWRARLIKSVLGVSEAQLHDWGLQKDFIDKLLVDDELRAEYNEVLGQHSAKLASIVRSATGEHYEEYLAEALRKIREGRP